MVFTKIVDSVVLYSTPLALYDRKEQGETPLDTEVVNNKGHRD